MSTTGIDLQHRLRRLERRSSSSAREVLRQYAGLQRFEELIERLEQTRCTLYQMDVVNAFVSILERGRAGQSGRATGERSLSS